MILTWLIVIPLAAGIATWALGRRPAWSRWIALAATLLDLGLVAALWLGAFTGGRPASGGAVPGGGASPGWLVEQQLEWIPRFGIHYHLALDGLSLPLVGLTALIGVVAVLVSWREIERRVGLFHSVLLWTLAGVLGVFLALDLFLFYFFWEVMLVPMYFLIGGWGHERRIYAAMKFFIYTLAGGLLLLLGILALYLIHGNLTGVYTFDLPALLRTPLDDTTGQLLMLAFLAGFLVKLPAVVLHTWLPDAHSQAPTAGSLVLAALLLKTGAYGLLRFVLPLFPAGAREFAPIAMLLGVIGIFYGALLAFGQTDLKRFVAYTSVSHMGFVLLGAFAGNAEALQGTLIQMIAHGVTTGALFAIAGMLIERTGTRDFARLGGLWTTLPRLGAVTLVFVMASLGLPGLGNFVGEILILIGVFRVYPAYAVVGAIGVVLATVYSLAIMQRIYHGPRDEEAFSGREALLRRDLTPREALALGVLVVAIVGLGLYPQPVMRAAAPVLSAISAGFLGGS